LRCAEPLAQLALGARVQKSGCGRREQRHHLPLSHRVARVQGDAFHAPGERRGDDVAVAYARLAIVHDGLLERPAPDLGGFHRDRLRAQRPGGERGHGEQGHRQQDLVACLHSRVFRTPTMSRLSIRLRTMSALTTPAATTTAPE
jgi:hypothetical protein